MRDTCVDAFGKMQSIIGRTEALPQLLLLRTFCVGEGCLKDSVKLGGV